MDVFICRVWISSRVGNSAFITGFSPMSLSGPTHSVLAAGGGLRKTIFVLRASE